METSCDFFIIKQPKSQSLRGANKWCIRFKGQEKPCKQPRLVFAFSSYLLRWCAIFKPITLCRMRTQLKSRLLFLLWKSLENKDDVWKNRKKSGEFFVLKTETSTLLLSEFFQVVKSYLKISSLAKTFNRRPRSLRSLLRQHCIVVTVCSQCIMGQTIYTKLGSGKRNYYFGKRLEKVFNFATKNLCEPCIRKCHFSFKAQAKDVIFIDLFPHVLL